MIKRLAIFLLLPLAVHAQSWRIDCVRFNAAGQAVATNSFQISTNRTAKITAITGQTVPQILRSTVKTISDEADKAAVEAQRRAAREAAEAAYTSSMQAIESNTQE